MEQEQIRHLGNSNLKSYYKADIHVSTWASSSKICSQVLYQIKRMERACVLFSDYH